VTEYGFYQFKRVPFGLKNAPAHVQRPMDAILAPFRWDFAMAFIDDIVVWSMTFEDHVSHVDQVLTALGEANLTLAETKCHFPYESVELLGHKVNRFGLSTQKAKVEAILQLPFPQTIKDAMIILGQFGYYRMFIQGYAEIAKPLTDGLRHPRSQVTKYQRKKEALKEQPSTDTLRKPSLKSSPERTPSARSNVPLNAKKHSNN
jgi:hypothetical protein